MTPGYCPKCNTPIEDYENSVADDDGPGYPFKCRQCGFKGVELYREIFQVFLDEDGNEVEILLDCAEAVQEITNYLAEANGELIVKIYNQITDRKAKYIGDSMISVNETDEE